MGQKNFWRDTWRTMDEKPSDGMLCLLYFPHRRIKSGLWDEDIEAFVTEDGMRICNVVYWLPFPNKPLKGQQCTDIPIATVYRNLLADYKKQEEVIRDLVNSYRAILMLGAKNSRRKEIRQRLHEIANGHNILKALSEVKQLLKI